MKSKDRSLSLLLCISACLLVLLSISSYYSSSYLLMDELPFLVASLFNAIAIVGIPIIFMTCGAILIDRTFNIKKYYRNVLNVLIIIAIWTVLYTLWNYFYLKTDTNIWLIPFESLYTPIKDHLGLLYIFFGIYLVLPFIQVLVKNLDEQLENLFLKLWLFFTGTVYLITVVFNFFGFDTNIIYNIPLFQGSYYLGYFIIGYIIYKNLREKGYSPGYNKYFVVSYLISTIITAFGAYALSVNRNVYCNQLFSFESLFVIMSSLSLFILIVNNMDRIFKSNKFSRLVRKLAPYSLGIYLVHIFFIDYIINIQLVDLLDSYIAIPVSFILIYTLSLLITFLIKKIPVVKKIF